MDKELQDAPVDIKNFEFFSGKSRRCFVNILENAACDCCKKMGGLAVEGLIAKCDQEEIALNDLRNRGQCHYIGKKDETVSGITVSHKHVYCCFSSKLARIFLEQARVS